MKVHAKIPVLLMLSMLVPIGFLMRSTGAGTISDWPIWVYPTVTRGDVSINYIGSHPDDWVSESWFIPVDFNGPYPKDERLYVSIQDRHVQDGVEDVVLVVALSPVARDAIRSVEVSPSTEGTVSRRDFEEVTRTHVPRGFSLNQHIYKERACYNIEFHVASILGEQGSTSPPDHVDLTVTLEIVDTPSDVDSAHVHFDCSALIGSDIVVNPWSRDTNTFPGAPNPSIPEIPFGTVMAGLAMVCALAAYVTVPRLRKKVF